MFFNTNEFDGIAAANDRLTGETKLQLKRFCPKSKPGSSRRGRDHIVTLFVRIMTIAAPVAVM